MKLFIGTRYNEITAVSKLMKESSESQIPILVSDEMEAKALYSQSRSAQFKVACGNMPKPVTMHSLKLGAMEGKKQVAVLLFDINAFISTSLQENYGATMAGGITIISDYEDNKSKTLDDSIRLLSSAFARYVTEGDYGSSYQVLKNIQLAQEIKSQQKEHVGRWLVDFAKTLPDDDSIEAVTVRRLFEEFSKELKNFMNKNTENQ